MNASSSPATAKWRPRITGDSVVVGAGDGIGRATAQALAEAGSRVTCVDIDEQRAQSVAAEVGGHAAAVDVLDSTAVAGLFADLRETNREVSCLVDVVGVAHLGPWVEMTAREWEWQFDIVLKHAIDVTRHAATTMVPGGTIVLVGSLSGLEAVPGQTAYGTAKAALHHFVRTAGVELARSGIRLNAVAPGFIRTPRLEAKLTARDWDSVARATPRGTAATTDEIAGVVLFLASGLSSPVVGQVIVADGGLGNQTIIPGLWD